MYFSLTTDVKDIYFPFDAELYGLCITASPPV